MRSFLLALLLTLAANRLIAVNAHPSPTPTDQPDPTPTPSPSGTPTPTTCSKEGDHLESLGFRLNFGGIPFEEGLTAGRLSIHERDASPDIFSPVVLQYEHVLATRLVPRAGGFTTIGWDGVRQDFSFTEGNSMGRPVPLTRANTDITIQRLDGARQPLTSATPTPIYVKVGQSDGTWTEYSVSSGAPVRYSSASRKLIDLTSLPAEVQLTIIYKSNTIRQVKAAQGLADIVSITGAEAFEIRLYNLANTGAFDSGTGLYQPLGTPYRTIRFENPNQGISYDTAKITDSSGGHASVSYFDYNVDLHLWTSRQGSGISQRKEYIATAPGPGANQFTTTRTLRDGLGTPISTITEVAQDFQWGREKISSTREPATFALTTTFTYVTSSSLPGYTKFQTKTEEDGFWEAYWYDSNNRLKTKTTPWKDSAYSTSNTQARVIVDYDYTSLDAGDTVVSSDFRARTETESVVQVDGGAAIVTSKTFHVYKVDQYGQQTIIEERAATNTAGYGATGNLKTIQVFYTSDSAQTAYDGVAAGRVKYIDKPDGTRTSYSYSKNAATLNAYFTESAINATAASPSGVDGLSTKLDRLYDVAGRLVKSISYIFSSGAWQLTAEEVYTMDDFGHVTVAERNNRQVQAASYDGDRQISSTDEDGVTTTYTYDELNRVRTETRVGAPASGSFAAQPNIVTTYTRELGGTSCDCDGVLSIQLSAGAMNRFSQTKKDPLGRLIEETNVKGLKTTYSYSLNGRQVTTTNPDTSTRVSQQFRDRRAKSVTGTGVVAQYLDYGVNADGSRWTKTNFSSANDARNEIVTTDFVGRTSAVARPSYDGNVILASYNYNSLGQLNKLTVHYVAGATDEAIAPDTFYYYDAFGNLTRSAKDIDGAGIAPASSDRITDFETTFANIESAWWLVRKTKVFPTLNSAATVTSEETRERLSGWTTTLAAETISIDVYGNATRRKIELNSTTLTRVETTTFPDSLQSAVDTSYNGRLVSSVAKSVSTATIYGYDALGHVVSVKDPRHAHPESMIYDNSVDQLLSVSDSASNTTTFEYFGSGVVGAGKVSLILDPQNHTTRVSYDLLGRKRYQWGTAEYPQSITYDSYGAVATLTTFRDTAAANLDSSTWPALSGGDATSWFFQPSTGLLTSKRYADNNGPDYTYDHGSRLYQRSWARSVSGSRLVTTYAYRPDSFDLQSVSYSDVTPTTSYAYNRLGEPTSITYGTDSTTLSYSPTFLSLNTETYSGVQGSRILSRSYQAAGAGKLPGRNAGYSLGISGNLAKDSTVSYTYDTVGRVASVAAPAGTYIYQYTPDSDLIGTIAGPKVTTTNTYDPERDLRTEVKHTIAGSNVARFQYFYDSLGGRTSRLQDGTAIGVSTYDIFGYDPTSQINNSKRYNGTNPLNFATDAENANLARLYTYDRIGNRLTSQAGSAPARVYTPTQLNQYSAITNPAASPTYDLDGNTLSDGSGWYYAWDGENRLISAQSFQTTPVSGSKKLTFSYDFIGRRISKKVQTYSGSAWSITSDIRFIYDGWNILLELNALSSFTTLRTYTWGLDLSQTMQGAGGIGGLLAVKQTSNSVTYSALSDANGNLMALINQATGSADAVYEYDAYGMLTKSSVVASATNACFIGFSGKYCDSDTSLNFFGYRYYNPNTGRWLSRDPMGEPGGANLYGFVQNDALNGFDFLGLVDPCKCKSIRQMILNITRMVGVLMQYAETDGDAKKSWADQFNSLTENGYSYSLAVNGYLETTRDVTQKLTNIFPGSEMKQVRRLARGVNDVTRRVEKWAKPISKNVTAISYIVDGAKLASNAAAGNWGDVISQSAGIGINATGPLGKVTGAAGQYIIDDQVGRTEDALKELDDSGVRFTRTMRQMHITTGLRTLKKLWSDYAREGCGPW